MYCKFLDRMSILKPPALNIAAEDPEGVAIHMPLDQTLKENNSSSSSLILNEGFAFPLHSASRNLDTAAGIGWVINKSFSDGGKRVSVYVLRTRH
eukprot:CAMPEP_0185000902 /NCGR_PEP_ID=MMETSP1098-20130426/69545_1 /TAXON_ID=89044 /ORGANISM="Spumella elongata, Strain CCAP 955/1" /LENGTH=94 /DNA_ID=CAMNT_0027528137 /DNA_START=308 /DNA_END=592 /DNA_ORIENTATION=+